MKFTLSWLREHLDTDAPLDALTDKLTMIGLEVEGVEDKARALAPFTFGQQPWHTLVFVNGRFAPELSRVDALPDGVRAMDLRRAWREAPELVDQLGQIASYDCQAFTALNMAFMNDGAVVHVERDRLHVFLSVVVQPCLVSPIQGASASSTSTTAP